MSVRSKSTRRLKYTSYLVFSLIFVACTGWFTYQHSAKTEARISRDSLKDRVELVKNYMKGELDRVDIVADILSQNPTLLRSLGSGISEDELSQANEILVKTNNKLATSAIYLMDKTGLTVAASNHNKEKSFIGKNYAFRPYFISAAQTGQGQFLAIGVTSNKLGYYVSRAVYEGDSLVGVIVIKVALDHMRSLSADFNGDFMVIDSKGVIFLSSNQTYQLKSVRPITADDRVFITKTKQYPISRIQTLNIQPSQTSFGAELAMTIDNQHYLQQKTDLPELGWSIWMLTNINAIRNQAISAGLATSFTFAIFFLAVFVLIKRKRDLNRFQTIVDNLPSGVTLFDDRLQMQMLNERVKEVLNLPTSLFQRNLPSLPDLFNLSASRGEFGEGDPEELGTAALEKLIENEKFLFEHIRRDGNILEIRGHWLEDKGLVTTFTDITERKNAEEEAKRNAAYLQALLQNLDQGVTVTDEKLNVVYWNKAFFNLLELPEDLEKPDLKYEDLLRYNAERGEYGPGDPEQHVQSRLLTALKFEPHHFERKRKDGKTLEVTGKPLIVNGKTLGFISTYVNITEHKRMAENLRKLANTDGLTGLFNRRHFNSQLQSEIKRCKRNGRALSLLILDLDFFKKVNDQFGHASGDMVLKEFAKTCKEVLRDIDIFGRMGGEEFAIYLPDTDRKGAQILAERLRQATENIVVMSEHDEKIPVTVSIGISFFDSSIEDTQDDLIIRADKALYKAKQQGRNRVC